MINKYSNVPLYCQLKNLIIDKINKGEYAEDEKIPSEQELCEAYGISRPTVRQAVSELTNNGYLFKKKGKGTFVTKSKTIIDIKNYTGFTDSILDSKNPDNLNIFSIKVIKNSENRVLGDLFNTQSSSNSDFAEISYLSKQHDEVFSTNTSYIPLSLFPNICEDLSQKKPSFELLRGKYPLIPTLSKSSMEVVYTDLSDASALMVQPGQPLIKIKNVLLSKSGQPVEYIISKYRADKCKLVFENHK